jgi:hypothetical protein
MLPSLSGLRLAANRLDLPKRLDPVHDINTPGRIKGASAYIQQRSEVQCR